MKHPQCVPDQLNQYLWGRDPGTSTSASLVIAVHSQDCAPGPKLEWSVWTKGRWFESLLRGLQLWGWTSQWTTLSQFPHLKQKMIVSASSFCFWHILLTVLCIYVTFLCGIITRDLDNKVNISGASVNCFMFHSNGTLEFPSPEVIVDKYFVHYCLVFSILKSPYFFSCITFVHLNNKFHCFYI